MKSHKFCKRLPKGNCRNDNFCDCSDCADEETWTCGTCGAFNEDEDQQEAQDVGAADWGGSWPNRLGRLWPVMNWKGR